MRTILVALMLCFAAPAFAQDMGTLAAPKSKKCPGVLVQGFEALSFATTQNVLILATMQVTDVNKLFTEQQQIAVVNILKRFDEVADPKEASIYCVKISPEEALSFFTADMKMAKALNEAHADGIYDQLLLLVIKDRKLAAVAVESAGKVMERMGRLLPQKSL